MPPGSKVWMKFEASACPDADGDDCLGSNQAGPNPPHGMPLTTFADANSSATGYAEVLPGSIRTYTRSNLTVFMHASFEDTYTVVGTAVGSFDIPVAFRMTGEARSVGVNCPGSLCHAMVVANGEAEIGTFSPLTTISGTVINEGFRVQAFDAAANASFLFPSVFTSTQVTQPIDVTAHHTVQDVSVGDTFTLAFGMNTRASRGEFDLLNTGTISFDLPPGVRLISSLAQSLVPEPSMPMLVTLALAAAIGPRRWRRNNL
jgi:hypothetical protein